MSAGVSASIRGRFSRQPGAAISPPFGSVAVPCGSGPRMWSGTSRSSSSWGGRHDDPRGAAGIVSYKVMEAASDAEVRELGFEPPPRGWRRVGVAEELEATGLTPGECRRWAMISVRGWAALPARRACTFAVAASLGKIMRKDGSFNRISNARDALCVVVRPEHRDRVLKVLGGRQARQWQRDVGAGVGAGVGRR